MQIAIIFRLKILFYLFFVLSPSKLCDGAPQRSSTGDKIYKKILQMRTLPFEDCGSTYDILYLGISSCNKIPCQMQRGSDAVVSVVFDDNGKGINVLKQRVSWVFNAIKSNAAINPDPCDDVHACLMSGNDGKSYSATVLINKSLPSIRGTMLWEAVDENDKSAICFRVPIVIIP